MTTVADLIRMLQKLPADHEVGILSTSAYARPPVLEHVNPYAWSNGLNGGGFKNPTRAFLIRPQQEIIG